MPLGQEVLKTVQAHPIVGVWNLKGVDCLWQIIRLLVVFSSGILPLTH